MIDFDVRVLGIPTGVIYLEQDVTETIRRIAGKAARKAFHVPDGSWTDEEFERAVDELEARPLALYDNFGACDWPTIKARIKYMAQVEGCEHIYLDHLTALAAAEADERKALEQIMQELASLAKALRIIIHFVSHLTTPDQGPSHEEGGRVTIRQFKGSRAIGFWSHILWGMERNQQHEDVAMQTFTILRCLKDRFTGRATGKVFGMVYDQASGMLRESDGPADSFADVEEAANAAGF
jgi:twinkle protein